MIWIVPFLFITSAFAVLTWKIGTSDIFFLMSEALVSIFQNFSVIIIICYYSRLLKHQVLPPFRRVKLQLYIYVPLAMPIHALSFVIVTIVNTANVWKLFTSRTMQQNTSKRVERSLAINCCYVSLIMLLSVKLR